MGFFKGVKCSEELREKVEETELVEKGYWNDLLEQRAKTFTTEIREEKDIIINLINERNEKIKESFEFQCERYGDYLSIKYTKIIVHSLIRKPEHKLGFSVNKKVFAVPLLVDNIGFYESSSNIDTSGIISFDFKCVDMKTGEDYLNTLNDLYNVGSNLELIKNFGNTPPPLGFEYEVFPVYNLEYDYRKYHIIKTKNYQIQYTIPDFPTGTYDWGRVWIGDSCIDVPYGMAEECYNKMMKAIGTVRFMKIDKG